MKVAIVGTGYVGLVSGVCFANSGIEVTCIDIDEQKIAGLQRGQIPILEAGLEKGLKSATESGLISFTSSFQKAIPPADVVFFAVGTPTDHSTGSANLTALCSALDSVGAELTGFTTLVTKSTVPVGTTRLLSEQVKAAYPNADFAFASNPEFLREGKAIEDFQNPDRLVFGVEDDRARSLLEKLYSGIVGKDTPSLWTGFETAELVKYAANAFLAAKVTFINEIADLCEATGADINDVAAGIGFDHRIGGSHLQPGPGYGGSCLPKDTAALLSTAKDVGVRLEMVDAVVSSNSNRKDGLIERVRKTLSGTLTNKTICVLGLTFKADTDDTRQSPSVDLVKGLALEGAQVSVYDPSGCPLPDELESMQNVRLVGNAYDACYAAEIAVVMTEWKEFSSLKLEKIRAAMAVPNILDCRNIVDAELARDLGLQIDQIGHAQRTSSVQ